MSEDIALNNYLETITVMDGYTDRIDGCSFYRYIFPGNECSGEQMEDYSKPNAIFLYENDIPNASKEYSRRIMLDDTWDDDYMEYVEQKKHTLCSGVTYRGKRTLSKNEQNMNALIFDLDGVGIKQIRTLLRRFTFSPSTMRSLPMPTFLVVSGGGVHLYYVFDEPIALFPNVKKQLKAMKDDLTYKMWDWKSTSQFKKVQYQRISQPFRMVGSINEKHGNEIVAYQLNDKVSIDYLNQYVMNPEDRVDIKKRYASRMTMEEAKEKYPEWAERVEKGTFKRSKWDIAGKTHGKDPWALYHWWLRQREHIKGGHRYFFMMFCVVYANKCDVPRDVVERDLREVFEALKDVDHENPLVEKDMYAALQIYKKDMYNYTIDDIKKLTEVPIEKNKRNHRSQKQHIKVMSAVRDALYENGSWRNKDGRPDKKNIVTEWKEAHPNGKKAECKADTGLSWDTIRKWWNGEEKQMEKPKVTAEKQKPLFDYIVKLPDGSEVVVEMEHSDNKEEELQRIKTYLQKISKS